MLKYLIGAAALTGLGAASAANAADSTATANLGVSANVTSNCVVSTSPVAFGNVDVTDGADHDATGSISVTCTNGTHWTATADAGSGSGASFGERQLAGESDTLKYALYTDSAYSTVWGDVESGSLSDDGNGEAQVKTIYGRIASGQTHAPAGAYADTVGVTVTY